MKNFYKVLIVCAGLATAAPVTAQSLYFNQYQQTPLLINPAFGAFRMDVQATVGYRTLNVGSSGADLNSTFLSVAYPLIKRVRRKETHYGYLGGTLLTDRTGANGALATTGLIASGGYRVPITKTITTVFGLGIGAFQRVLNTTQIKTDNQFDASTGVYLPSLPNGEQTANGFTESKIYPVVNFGAGIVRQNRYKEVIGYFGISGSNLNQPSISFYGSSAGKYPFHINAIGEYRVFDNYQYMITPTFRYTYVNSLFQQTNVGSLFHYKLSDRRSGFLGAGSAGVGLWYNLNGVAVTSLELNQPRYKVGLAYDFYLNGQNAAPAKVSQIEVFFTYKKYLGREKMRKSKYSGGGRSRNFGPARR